MPLHNLGEDMSGIHPNIYKRLRTTLLNCGPFASDSELKAAFIDARINPWRDRLPQAGNPASRVKATVDFLYNQYSETQENALVLLLRVLSDQSHSGDACHLELAELASELESAIKGPDMPSEEQPVQTLPQQLNTPRSHQPRQSADTSVGEKPREFVMSETMDLREHDVLTMRQRELLSKCLEKLTKNQFDELVGLTLLPPKQDDLTLPRTKANFLNDMQRWHYLDKVERVLRREWPDLVAPYLAKLDKLSPTTVNQEPPSKTIGEVSQTRPSKIYPEVPPHPILEFTNRLEEIRELTDPYAPAYYLVDAPARYGKTTLLKKVQRRFRAKSWNCAYVSVQEHRELPAIIQELASRLGILDSIESNVVVQAYTNAKVAGKHFGEAFKKHMKSDQGSLIACDGLVLLIDIDRNPWNALMRTASALLKDFIPGVEQVLRDFRPFRDAGSHNPFRVILAGRYLRYWVNEISHSLPFETLLLTPFRDKPVQDATEAFLNQGDTEQIVAHLLHYTTGHPGCIARVLELYKRRNESPDQFFKNYTDEILDGIVYPEAEAVRRNIPSELSGYSDDLSVFRYLNEAVLHIWMQDLKLPPFDREFEDEFELADALVESCLMAYENDLLQDNITRRLLAIRLLRDVGPRRFARRCQQARRICQEYLEDPSAQRPHLWAIESLFQFLQSHMGDTQNTDKRAEIRQAFLDETVSQVLTLLIKNRDPRRESRALARALRDDWEFQFTVNYYLRADQHNSEPYKSLEKQIDVFFATEIGRQGES